MANSWNYPIAGAVTRIGPEEDHVVELPVEMHYFTKQSGSYTPSGVLRSVALFLDGLDAELDSVESMTFFPELGGWAATIAVYHDQPSAQRAAEAA